MKRFVFRLDIDTPTCLNEGVPRLLELSAKLGVRFSYFLSVGRSVSRADAFLRLLRGRKAGMPRAAALSPMRKLGLRRYLWLAAANPEIGRGAPEMVRRIAAEADLGLHGGKNHDLWQHGAPGWSRTEVEQEVDWALGWLTELGLSVAGFCSPGWSQPRDLGAVLAARGFTYRADWYGADATGAVVDEHGVLNLATNMVGIPGGVAYVEHLRAQNLSDAEVRSAFRERLRELGDYAVAYDHPYFAGVHALNLVEDLVLIAMDEGFEVTTLTETASALSG